jgi:hypothetical protein
VISNKCIALCALIGTPTIAFAGWAAVQAGNQIWLPINTYQQEKLYEKKDEAADLTDKQTLGIPLTDLEKLKLQRILRDVERLQNDLQ